MQVGFGFVTADERRAAKTLGGIGIERVRGAVPGLAAGLRLDETQLWAGQASKARACVTRYSSTKIFFFAHICFKMSGHTVTLTSPRWAFRSNCISVRDCPIPPPIDSGNWSLMIA